MIDNDSDAYKAGVEFGGQVVDVIKSILRKYGLNIMPDDLPDESNTVEGSLLPARQLAIEAPKEEK